MTGASKLLQENIGYYDHLVSIPEATSNKAIRQIDKDISRTFPGNDSFSKIELRRVLVAYSLRNPNVGYCQGLNFVVATILSIGFTPEESF